MKRLWMRSGTAESREAVDVYHGGDVLDVGAFQGWYSVLLAPLARPGDRLVSFEPDHTAIPVLRATLANLRKHFPRVDLLVVTEAVGDGRPVSATHPGGAVEGTHPRFESVADSDARRSVILDEVVAARALKPSLVKIDVEGAELSVLRGMYGTLRRHRPIVLLEIHPAWQPAGVDATDVEAFLREANYDGRTLEELPNLRRQVWFPLTLQSSVPLSS